MCSIADVTPSLLMSHTLVLPMVSHCHPIDAAPALCHPQPVIDASRCLQPHLPPNPSVALWCPAPCMSLFWLILVFIPPLPLASSSSSQTLHHHKTRHEQPSSICCEPSLVRSSFPPFLDGLRSPPSPHTVSIASVLASRRHLSPPACATMARLSPARARMSTGAVRVMAPQRCWLPPDRATIKRYLDVVYHHSLV